MEEKMSRGLFLIIVVAAFVFFYLLLKGFIIFAQDVFTDKEIYSKSYVSGSTMTINTNKDIDNYLDIKGKDLKIKVVNKFDGFVLEDSLDNYESYILYNPETNMPDSMFSIGTYSTQMSFIHNYNEDGHYYEFNHFPLYVSDLLRNRFLNKYNIKNDVDLIKHIRERKKIKSTMKTPLIKIKENYFFNYIELALPPLDDIVYLDGDIEGYMFIGDNKKIAYILDGDKLYCLTFNNLEYFTDDVIKEILDSVIIK